MTKTKIYHITKKKIMKFITKRIHAYLDYPVAFALMGMPFLLQIGGTNSIAFYLSVITGVAAFLLTAITDHKLGIIKLVSYKFHLTVDFIVGLAFVTLPFILGFSGLDLIYYLVNGGAVLLVVSLHKGEKNEKIQFS